MPAFSGKFNWKDGLIWQVGFIPSNKSKTPKIPNIDRIHLCPALVDTGACRTCISSSIAEKLQLKPSGKIQMQTATDFEEVNVYDVHPAIALPAAQSVEGELESTLQVFSSIQSPESVPRDPKFEALIGRDILQQGILTMSFDGHYTFSW